MKPFLESNDALNHPDEIRSRADRDGYLFFRGLADRDAVLKVRSEFVKILDRHGWLDAGADPNDLITSQPCRVEGQEEFWPIFCDFQRLECFQALAHDPNALGVLEAVLGESVLVHPRNIGRIMFPTTPTTPPHQDFIHIQGTPNVWTAWMPLGDVPEELGGLAVLKGTHQQGLLPVRRMPGAGGVGVDTDPNDANWVTGAFYAGDVLLFHSLTVHKSLPNRTNNRMRLSVDYRYQGVTQPIVEGSLLPHFNRFGWDFVYEGWKSDRYQYYWNDLPLNIVGYDRDKVRFADAGQTQRNAY